MDNILGAILMILMGVLFGWIFAHGEVANDCRKLNSFYVGDTIFHCGVKK